MKHLYYIGILWFSFFSIFGTENVLGQEIALNPSKPLSKYILSIWGKNEGLPSQSLTKVMQSSDKYLWISSYNGLYRFDGNTFKTYGKTESNILLTNSFSQVQERSDGTLFIGTGGSGLLTYQSDSFKIFGGDSPRFSSPVSSFYFSDDESVWVGSRGEGLYLFKQDTFWAHTEEPLLNNVTISSIAEDKDRSLYFATEGNGVVVMKEQGYSYINEENGLLSSNVSALYHDSKGRIWMGTSEGLNYLDAHGEIQSIKAIERFYVNRVEEDDYGSIWVGTTKGLFRINERTAEVEYLSTKDGLPHANVNSFSFDHEGNLWMTTYRGGLCRLKDTKFENYTKRDGLMASPINAVCKLDDGVLIATGSDIHVLKGRKVTHKPIKTTIPSAWFKSITQTESGAILISTYSGLLVIYPDGKEWLLTTDEGLPDNQVRVAMQDKDGYIWLGTRAGGAVKLNLETRSMEVFNEANKLSSNFIMSIEQDNKGNILFGLNDKGLDVLTPDGEVKNYDKKIIGSSLIFNTYVDRNNDYWIGTNAGLTLLRDNGEYKHITKQDGLGSDVIFDIVEDNVGSLWLTSSDGLLKLSKNELLSFTPNAGNRVSSKIHTEDDGMVSSECTGVTQSIKTDDGKLYFPTLGGLTVFDPSYELPQAPAFPVYINKVTVDGKDINLHEPEIQLASDTRRIIFHYTALHLSAPSQVQYRYRIEGYEDWVLAQGERKAIYTNMTPGWHDFSVMASDGVSHWNSRQMGSIRFYRKPKLTETTWFYVVLGIISIFLGFTIYKTRTRQIERQNKELERLVNLRTKELQAQQVLVLEQNEDLKQKQEEILAQNNELHQKQEEISSQRDDIEYKNQELHTQKVELEKSYDNVRLLAEVGRSITSALDLKGITKQTYEQVNHLMDATGFGVCIYNESQQTITYDGYIEKGETLEPYTNKFNPDTDLASWCIQHRKPILINNLAIEYSDYLSISEFNEKTGDLPSSLIYLPLIVKNKVLGAVTVQSFQQNSYAENDLDLLSSLGSYLAVAVENAEAYLELQKSKNIIEEKNQNTMASIRYAKTIQQSVLPTTATLNEYLSDHFILYRPKDLVSGDFYWCKEIDGKVFIATVDCTGHGVPGAFMSMIGNDLLDTIIARERIFDPAQILASMHSGIVRALQQDTQKNSDGMDMVICMLEYQEGDKVDVTFAGAKRPLFYITDGTLHEEKGDRKSVGGWQKRDNPYYTSVPLQLKKGDFLYLTSDGYVDQASPSRRKFGTGKLRKLLNTFASKPVAEQGAILTQVLDDHQQGDHQRDDITFFIAQL